MRHICRILPILAVLGGLSWGPAKALDCRENAEAEMSRLPLQASQVDSVRFVEKRNPAEKGPEILGVRAWVRLNSCDGYLVIDMTRSCFVRQSYTRGGCKVEGVTAY